jgi:Fe-S-cluster-containing dehydrogenase component
MNRRDLLKTVGAAAATAMVADGARAQETTEASDSEVMGILVDTTLCVGCRSCEFACAEEHADSGLEAPEDVDWSEERPTSPTQWTLVNRYETDQGEMFRKTQCMHCLTPACANACLTKAMHKTEDGPVAWDGDRCMGCRFCMLSCPFDVPKFEYDSANPRIQKCTMCFDRVAEGREPACVEACPMGALTFGKRSELLDEARERIYHAPDQYVHHIYGEHEAGGTGYLYLASVPFEQLGLRTDLSEEPYPVYTREFLYGVPVVLTLVPPLLVGLAKAAQERSNGTGDAKEEDGELSR